jgi:hypothetical protein
MRRSILLSSTLLAHVAVAGCSSSGATNPTERSTAPQTEALPAAPMAQTRPGPDLPAASASAPVAPLASAAAEPQAPASASPPSPGPLPAVKIANIGMHIGGGPNDAKSKEPIRRSVEPHFDELRRCFALALDPKKGGDFGVDLRIEKDGGQAQVTKPRTALKGEGFTKCVVSVFEAIEFLKPTGGLTVVSYSLRFTP